jgi:hypothetical protein
MPDEVVDAEDAEFDYLVAGTIGRDFDPPIELNQMPWFSRFLRTVRQNSRRTKEQRRRDCQCEEREATQQSLFWGKDCCAPLAMPPCPYAIRWGFCPIVLKSQSNFSLGINEIQDAMVVEQLTALAKGIDIPSLSASCEYSPPSDIDILDIEVTEGRAKYVAHLRRERNRAVIEVKKTEALTKYGRLCCEVCGFDFGAFYGELGEGFCEVHHKIPLASLDGKRVTTLADLAIVCSNCHRVLHRHKPMPNVTELREHINRAKT